MNQAKHKSLTEQSEMYPDLWGLVWLTGLALVPVLAGLIIIWLIIL